VALTCRYYGISRQVFYVWYRRYEAGGLAGLRDRSECRYVKFRYLGDRGVPVARRHSR
jgi:hypothetical protein